MAAVRGHRRHSPLAWFRILDGPSEGSIVSGLSNLERTFGKRCSTAITKPAPFAEWTSSAYFIPPQLDLSKSTTASPLLTFHGRVGTDPLAVSAALVQPEQPCQVQRHREHRSCPGHQQVSVVATARPPRTPCLHDLGVGTGRIRSARTRRHFSPGPAANATSREFRRDPGIIIV